MDKRSFVGNFSLAVGLTMSGIYMPWLLNVIGDWKIFHIFLMAQNLVILTTPFFVFESVRWLASKGECSVYGR